MPNTFKVGDVVGYKSVLTDPTFQALGPVHTVLPNGIPSCRKPMLMIQGKAGVVLASHCTIIETQRKP